MCGLGRCQHSPLCKGGEGRGQERGRQGIGVGGWVVAKTEVFGWGVPGQEWGGRRAGVWVRSADLFVGELVEVFEEQAWGGEKQWQEKGEVKP